VDRGVYSILLPAKSRIHFDSRLLMTADGRGHEALLRHSARRGLFFARGGVLLTGVDRGNLGT
jgi:hypothetical protein